MKTMKVLVRGYNPAELLAERVAHVLKRPWTARALVKIRKTKPQMELPRTERLKNVEGAFRARARWIRNRSLLLVDDVLTTGATANACTQALFEAGAQEVFVAVAGR